MPKLTQLSLRFIALALISSSFLPRLSAADGTAEEIVAKHLDSLGTAAARAAIKSRVVQGTAHFRFVIGGSGELDGKAGMVSEQTKSAMLMKFTGEYRGEQFISDGDKTYVATGSANHRRSSFGEFLHGQDYMLRDGLLGGELLTSWALLNLDKTQAKVDYSGLKKFDGQSVRDLRYHVKKRDDMNIHIYLDAETYRHVGTTYNITLGSGLAEGASGGGADVTQSSKQREIRYTVEERFTDFKTVDGITLPTHYNLRYTQELQSGATAILEWSVVGEDISHNGSLDPRNFEIK